MGGAITCRDGLVGAFDEDAILSPVLQPLDAIAPFERWEPWVRNCLVDSALLEGLSYARVGAHGLCLCADDARLVTIERPDLSKAGAMNRQVELVIEYAALREERATELLSQVPQLATYWAAVMGLHPQRTPRTLELLAAAVRLAITVEMRFKHAFAFPRPVQFSHQVQPMILTPQHSAYPSGHSTEAHTVAYTLIYLLGLQPDSERARTLLRLAGRIAINRTVAGVHFPIDSHAGRVLGWTLAGFLLSRCRGLAPPPPISFTPGPLLAEDFLSLPTDAVYAAALAMALKQKPSLHLPRAVDGDLPSWLWQQAAQEWI